MQSTGKTRASVRPWLGLSSSERGGHVEIVRVDRSGPALEAGLNAVFIPHPHTWNLERCEIRPGEGRLLTIERFADLKNHF